MNLSRKLRCWRIERETDRHLAERRLVRAERRAAAERGISASWKRRAAQCKAVFNV